jgi:phage-related protein
MSNTKEDSVIKLMLRRHGADIHELHKTNVIEHGVEALRIAERRGLWVRVVKYPGELKRYMARRDVAR